MTGLAWRDTLIRDLGRFRADEQGATAIEYALVAGGIAVAVIASIASLGVEVKTKLYDKIAALF